MSDVLLFIALLVQQKNINRYLTAVAWSSTDVVPSITSGVYNTSTDNACIEALEFFYLTR